MYALKNKVQLIGNIGKKPEIRLMGNGIKLARFLLAINESYKNAKGQKIKETQWHTLVVSGRLADLVEKCLDKGKEIAIEGRLVNRSYIDKDGIKRFNTEIQVNEILILGNRGESLAEEDPAFYSTRRSIVKEARLIPYISLNTWNAYSEHVFAVSGCSK